VRVEASGGVWRRVEACGGEWRRVEACSSGGVWRRVDACACVCIRVEASGGEGDLRRSPRWWVVKRQINYLFSWFVCPQAGGEQVVCRGMVVGVGFVHWIRRIGFDG
jgi:hypothetical protein